VQGQQGSQNGSLALVDDQSVLQGCSGHAQECSSSAKVRAATAQVQRRKQTLVVAVDCCELALCQGNIDGANSYWSIETPGNTEQMVEYGR
jgi:hypothetical protein